MSECPPGWERRFTPEGRPYFVDQRTGQSHWTLPTAPAGPGGWGGSAVQQQAAYASWSPQQYDASAQQQYGYQYPQQQYGSAQYPPQQQYQSGGYPPAAPFGQGVAAPFGGQGGTPPFGAPQPAQSPAPAVPGQGSAPGVYPGQAVPPQGGYPGAMIPPTNATTGYGAPNPQAYGSGSYGAPAPQSYGSPAPVGGGPYGAPNPPLGGTYGAPSGVVALAPPPQPEEAAPEPLKDQELVKVHIDETTAKTLMVKDTDTVENLSDTMSKKCASLKESVEGYVVMEFKGTEFVRTLAADILVLNEVVRKWPPSGEYLLRYTAPGSFAGVPLSGPPPSSTEASPPSSTDLGPPPPASGGPPPLASGGQPPPASEGPPPPASGGPPPPASGGPPLTASGGPPPPAIGGPTLSESGGTPPSADSKPPTSTSGPPLRTSGGPPRVMSGGPPLSAPPSSATGGPFRAATSSPKIAAVAAPPSVKMVLPPGYEKATDSSGRVYYKDLANKKTSWTAPELVPELPPGWEVAQDKKSGKYYYKDTVNKKTSWTRPPPVASEKAASTPTLSMPSGNTNRRQSAPNVSSIVASGPGGRPAGPPSYKKAVSVASMPPPGYKGPAREPLWKSIFEDSLPGWAPKWRDGRAATFEKGTPGSKLKEYYKFELVATPGNNGEKAWIVTIRDVRANKLSNVRVTTSKLSAKKDDIKTRLEQEFQTCDINGEVRFG